MAKPRKFDEARFSTLTAPFNVRVIKQNNGIPSPLDIPHNGVGWDVEQVRNLEPWVKAAPGGGGGFYTASITDTQAQTMEWDFGWLNREVPPNPPNAAVVAVQSPPAMSPAAQQPPPATTNNWSTPIPQQQQAQHPPMQQSFGHPPFGSAPGGGLPAPFAWQPQPPWQSFGPQFHPQAQQQFTPWGPPPQIPQQIYPPPTPPADYRAQAEEARLREAQLKSQVEMDRLKLQMEFDNKMRDLVAQQNAKPAVDPAIEQRLKDAEDRARKAEERAEREASERRQADALAAIQRNTDAQIAAMREQNAQLMQAITNSKKDDGGAQMAILTSFMAQQQAAAAAASQQNMTMMQILSQNQEKSVERTMTFMQQQQSNEAGIMKNVAPVFEMMKDATQVALQVGQQIQGGPPSTGQMALGMLADAVKGAPAIMENILAKRQQAQQGPQVVYVPTPAQNFAPPPPVAQKPEPVQATIQQQPEQPKIPVTPPVEATAETKPEATPVEVVPAGTPIPPSEDEIWFGPSLPYIKDLREAVLHGVEENGQRRRVTPVEVATNILRGFDQGEKFGIKIKAGEELFKAGHILEFVDRAIPQAGASYKEEVAETLFRMIGEMAQLAAQEHQAAQQEVRA